MLDPALEVNVRQDYFVRYEGCLIGESAETIREVTRTDLSYRV